MGNDLVDRSKDAPVDRPVMFHSAPGSEAFVLSPRESYALEDLRNWQRYSLVAIGKVEVHYSGA